MLYQNRREAGKKLAGKLEKFANHEDVLVLALSRDSVQVASEIAHVLHAPLDIFLVRKLGLSWHWELPLGTIASGGVRILNEKVVHILHISDKVIEAIADEETHVLDHQERLLRGDRPAPNVHSRVVILVDDGMSTGANIKTAVQALKTLNPAQIVVALPIGPSETCEDFQDLADETVCACVPGCNENLATWYEDCCPPTDEEIHHLLDQSPKSTFAPREPAEELFTGAAI